MFDEPQFTLAQVANAAGCSVGTLRSWLQRKHFRLDAVSGDSPADVAGKAHLLTLRRALHIGASVELIRNNVEPARAFRAALSFVDVFDTTFEAEGRVRGPEGLFFDGWTFLFAYPGTPMGVITWVDDRTSINETPCKNIIFPRIIGGVATSGTFVWLNRIDRQIRTTLNTG